MGHGLHGFSRIKQSKHIWESGQSLPFSLNKNFAKYPNLPQVEGNLREVI
jgi:hypothetical protein